MNELTSYVENRRNIRMKVKEESNRFIIELKNTTSRDYGRTELTYMVRIKKRIKSASQVIHGIIRNIDNYEYIEGNILKLNIESDASCVQLNYQ